MAIFWRSPSGKIIVSAAGKPIDCGSCPCGPQPITAECCAGFDLPFVVPVKFTVTSGACADLDGVTINLTHREISGSMVFGGYTYLWISEEVSVGGAAVRVLVYCQVGGTFLGAIVSADGLTDYGTMSLSYLCCCPLILYVTGYIATIGTCSATFTVTSALPTIYLTLSGATGDCAFINGTWALDYVDGTAGWNSGYIVLGAETFSAGLVCSGSVLNLGILLSYGSFTGCSLEDAPGSGTINFSPACPFSAASGVATIASNGGLICSCSDTVNWSLSV